MAEIAIKVDGVSKSFKLPHEKQSSIKGLFVNIFRRKRSFERQEVLKNISIEINEGEFFGIVGRNGSGKSTLLKLLAGIYSPDKGAIHINGKLIPFIELGVGFSPELTGKDNVFLNGSLLGFSRKEMEAMYDEIVAFAELERFMDQKLKNYSSGMQVRLAFSIAIRAKGDILLLDEVLAVGDARFQKKCYEYFITLKRLKKTVVLVTHDMGSVVRFCTRVLVIDKSKQIGVFTPLEAKNIYDEINAPPKTKDEIKEDETKAKRWGNKKIEIANISVLSDGVQVDGIKNPVIHGKKFQFQVDLIHNNQEDALIGLAIYDEQDVNITGPNSFDLLITHTDKSVVYSVEKLMLNSGDYKLAAGVFDRDTREEFDFMPVALKFRVINKGIEKYGKIDMFGTWEKA